MSPKELSRESVRDLMRAEQSSADDEDAVDTLAERAAAILHGAVISGELAPGTKLRIRELMQHYGIGATPLREGLSRLVTAGLVQANSQRGFSVMPISRADLEDIIRTRILIERQALRLSIERGDDAWEAEIVAALYRLRKACGSRADGTPETDADFNTLHRSFHTALIAACGSPRLLELHRVLFDQTFRYRQVFRRSRASSHKITLDEHQRLADATLARDFDKAATLLERHLKVTLAVAFGPEGEVSRQNKAEARRRATRRGVVQ